MPKSLRKRFVLVSIDDNIEQINAARKLRRYLTNNHLNHIFSSTPEEMKEYLDKLDSGTFNFRETAEEQKSVDPFSEANQPAIQMSSNQEILEKWARGTFAENSDALKLLLEPTNIEEDAVLDDHESENIVNNIPQLFMVNSMDAETPNDSIIVENGKEDQLDMAYCSLCKHEVETGRNRNTKIRKQTEHVLDAHPESEFLNVDIAKRYECVHCLRTLPVSKSPCEHISEHHDKTHVEIEFRDLWSNEQVSTFNSVMEKCFLRHLPVPRSRRIRNGNTWYLSEKASYRIVRGGEIIHISTVADKSKTDNGKESKQSRLDNSERGKPTRSMDSDYDIFDNQDETDSEEGARSESIDTGNKESEPGSLQSVIDLE
ncbi:C2H2-type domain-containing protein [Caenorhabditis elegans]|uniref:C2H2-type domain-containing protein n=1 Tax=Caenorhabditis elegans TaxID=6239 RepID=Q20629_CAEEL|nr:C2H2-type domain-containing protein [Caenorhabditis elegans]CCD70451.2 C2H2-type domain-containing protein [Caenorhabditis elegans]|eukprot:NP_001255304.2 Oocyte Excluded Factor [Caenorhabditis elegans]